MESWKKEAGSDPLIPGQCPPNPPCSFLGHTQSGSHSASPLVLHQDVLLPLIFVTCDLPNRSLTGLFLSVNARLFGCLAWPGLAWVYPRSFVHNMVSRKQLSPIYFLLSISTVSALPLVSSSPFPGWQSLSVGYAQGMFVPARTQSYLRFVVFRLQRTLPVPTPHNTLGNF